MHEPDIGLDELAREVVDAAFNVHRELGPAYLASVYEAALSYELGVRGISFERQLSFEVFYRGHVVGCGRVDLLVAKSLVVELKAVDAIAPIHTAQMLSYLRALRLPLGLLINFNAAYFRSGVRRIVLTRFGETATT